MAWGWLHHELIFIFGWTIPIRCVLVDQITSRWGRYIAVYTCRFNTSLLSWFMGRFYGRVHVWAFSDLSIYWMKNVCVIYIWTVKHIENSSFSFCPDNHKTSQTLWMCVRNQECWENTVVCTCFISPPVVKIKLLILFISMWCF